MVVVLGGRQLDLLFLLDRLGAHFSPHPREERRLFSVIYLITLCGSPLAMLSCFKLFFARVLLQEVTIFVMTALGIRIREVVILFIIVIEEEWVLSTHCHSGLLVLLGHAMVTAASCWHYLRVRHAQLPMHPVSCSLV